MNRSAARRLRPLLPANVIKLARLALGRWLGIMLARVFALGLAVTTVFAAGCASYEQTIARRHERLLQIYPLGTTTRADVAQKWAPLRPELALTRPASGWLALDSPAVGRHLDAIERTSGKTIAGFERYFGADGLFSLCRCWFYYDAAGRLVEVEWQYASD